MIQTYQKIISVNEQNDTLEIDTSGNDKDSVTLTINHCNHWEEIDLTPEQVEQVVQQLGAWLGERAI